MIPQTELNLHEQDWQWHLKHCIRDAETLAQSLNLSLLNLDNVHSAQRNFPVNVPLPYLSRIEPGRLDDPLLRQVLASPEELLKKPGFSDDPVGDGEANILPGVLHKYSGRVLLIVSTHCAINCRYCFRRNFPYEQNRSNQAMWREALNYIADDKNISEVIYSGGDPLAISDDRLAWLSQEIARIPHIKRLRIHTRLPVVIPQRVDDKLLDWLTGNRLKPVMVLHINHANEMDNQVFDMARKLRQAGVNLLNQSVLLKGVNDTADALVALSERLFDAGILPYYLHQLDAVRGADHFAVEDNVARQLYHAIRCRLPGYLVPALVREKAGSPYKLPVF